MPKVSIIIPVYQTEAFLEKCLDSVIHQTHQDIEIIILNDGSQDGSHNLIMNKYVSDARVTYLTHANRGLGPTRNRGIEMATGEYLCFIDSDDFVELDMIESLVQDAILHDSDIVCCEHYQWVHDHDYARAYNFRSSEQVSMHTIDDVTFIQKYYVRQVFSISSWAKLYKTAVIKNNNIQFGDNRRVFAEDRYFNLCLLAHVDRISFLHRPLYFYRHRAGSLMNSYKSDLLIRHLNMIDDIRDFVANQSQTKIIHKVTALFLVDALYKEFANMIEFKQGFKRFLAILHEIDKRDKVRTYLQEVQDQRLYKLLYIKERRRAKYLVLLLKYRLFRAVTYKLYVDYLYKKARTYVDVKLFRHK